MAKEPKFAIGIDLGGTKILAAFVNRKGTIIERVKLPTKIKKSADLIQMFFQAIDTLLDYASWKREDGCTIGIGAAGLIDPDRGIILQAPNLKVLEDLNLRQPLQERYQIPVFIDNDVNVGTFGELQLGAGQGASDVVGIFLGTGIGGGIITNGQIYHGFTKTAGEIGHVSLRYNGKKHPLNTAPRGTLEAYAGRLAIARQIRKQIKQGKSSIVPSLIDNDWKRFKSGTLKKALKKDDKVVQDVLSQTAEFVGIGIANIAHTLGPQKIIVGGGVMEAVGDYLLPRIIQSARSRTLENSLKGVEIVEAALADDAIILGAAMLAFQKYQPIQG